MMISSNLIHTTRRRPLSLLYTCAFPVPGPVFAVTAILESPNTVCFRRMHFLYDKLLVDELMCVK